MDNGEKKEIECKIKRKGGAENEPGQDLNVKGTTESGEEASKEGEKKRMILIAATCGRRKKQLFLADKSDSREEEDLPELNRFARYGLAQRRTTTEKSQDDPVKQREENKT